MLDRVRPARRCRVPDYLIAPGCLQLTRARPSDSELREWTSYHSFPRAVNIATATYFPALPYAGNPSYVSVAGPTLRLHAGDAANAPWASSIYRAPCCPTSCRLNLESAVAGCLVVCVALLRGCDIPWRSRAVRSPLYVTTSPVRCSPTPCPDAVGLCGRPSYYPFPRTVTTDDPVI